MAKKYRYDVMLSAEEEMVGTIDLTKKEAAIVAFATDSNNWKNVMGGGYTGSFFIDIDNPKEIND